MFFKNSEQFGKVNSALTQRRLRAPALRQIARAVRRMNVHDVFSKCGCGVLDGMAVDDQCARIKVYAQRALWQSGDQRRQLFTAFAACM